MRFLYTLGIRLYGLGVRLASLSNPKARQWIAGRRGLFDRLAGDLNTAETWVWLHAASAGEFEQGRPVLEKIKHEHPACRILLTFFSPSGLRFARNYQYADIIEYLPLDTPSNARRFIQSVNPALAIFIKYEIWINYYRELQRRNVPTILISAQFRKDQWFFNWYGGFALKILRQLTRIFTADRSSYALLRENGFNNAFHCGDTRVDRVVEVSKRHGDFTYLRKVLGHGRLLVAGSTWEADEDVIIPVINRRKLQAVIAPHELSDSNLSRLEKAIDGKCMRLSQIDPAGDSVADVVIVDTMGQLAQIYHIGDFAYVGGGFGSGIHNILEPVAHGLAVAFGPKHAKFQEAAQILEKGIGTSVSSPADFESFIEQYSTDHEIQRVGKEISEYLGTHAGATECIYAYIRENQLITDVVAG